MINLQVRAFCGEHCNSGWMSRMENQTKPILSRYMLAEHPRVLTAGSQEALAAWAYKTFLTMAAWHDQTLISRQEYERFYIERHPGSAAIMWMGAYSGDQWASKFRIRGVDIRGGGRVFEAPHNAVTAVFNIFRVVFVIFRWFGARMEGETGEQLDPRQHLSRIWPVTSPYIRWPVGHAFTEDEYATFEVSPD